MAGEEYIKSVVRIRTRQVPSGIRVRCSWGIVSATAFRGQLKPRIREVRRKTDEYVEMRIAMAAVEKPRSDLPPQPTDCTLVIVEGPGVHCVALIPELITKPDVEVYFV